MSRAGLFLMTAAFLAFSASANTPQRESFNFGWSIQTDAGASLYEIELPFEFYQAATDLRLRDVGVFDSNGQPVPRLIDLPAKSTSSRVYKTRNFKLFPVYRNASGAEQPGKLVFQQTGDETVLTYDGGAASPSTSSDRHLDAYVIDARALKYSLNRLELAWVDTAEPFIAQVTVEGSSDLLSWRQLGQGSVAELRQGGSSIARRYVNLKSGTRNYLRVRWSGVPKDWQLVSARGRYVEEKTAPTPKVTRTKQQSSTGRDEDDGGYLFDLGGAPLVDQIQLSLPADNTVVKAAVFADPAGQGRWRRVEEQIFYNLRRDNQTLQNEPLDFTPVRARHWKVIVSSGRSDLDLSMALRWQPDRLRFVAQGTGPYDVVAGRAEEANANFPMHAQYGDKGIFEVSRVAGSAQTATLGDRFELRGQSRAAAPIVEWRKWALWFALFAGVLVVAVMAARLLRQFNSD